MPYYEEGRRYLPEVPDRSADYPKLAYKIRKTLTPQVLANLERPLIKTCPANPIGYGFEPDELEQLRENFYNELNHAKK